VFQEHHLTHLLKKVTLLLPPISGLYNYNSLQINLQTTDKEIEIEVMELKLEVGDISPKGAFHSWITSIPACDMIKYQDPPPLPPYNSF
jgi:hypothetical protein